MARDWDAICRVVHQCWVGFQLGAGQSYNVEPDAEDMRSNRIGVEFALANPEAGLGAQHDLWMKTRLADGWVYGPVKDKVAKTHPDLVPYEELPEVERRKDENFRLAARLALRLFPTGVDLSFYAGLIDRVIDVIVTDLCDRRGLGHAWGQIDPVIQEEIRRVWAAAIVEVFSDATRAQRLPVQMLVDLIRQKAKV